MASSTGSNPEDEYADDEYADYDAEDREQPSVPAGIPDEEPEDDVLEQRQEVPYGDDEDDRERPRYLIGLGRAGGRSRESAPGIRARGPPRSARVLAWRL